MSSFEVGATPLLAVMAPKQPLDARLSAPETVEQAVTEIPGPETGERPLDAYGAPRSALPSGLNGLSEDASDEAPDKTLQQPAADSDAALQAEAGMPKGMADRFTEEQLRQIADLKARDREVKAHEQAHATVGGRYASAPSYEYQVGPDQNRYAIGGHVMIDVAPVAGDPEGTIAKMNVVHAAALAPAEPSAADQAVAATARAVRSQAQAELTAVRAAERQGETEQDGDAAAKEAAQSEVVTDKPTEADDIAERLGLRSVFEDAKFREAEASYAETRQRDSGLTVGALAS